MNRERGKLRRALRSWALGRRLRGHPRLVRLLRGAELALIRKRHALGARFPALIRPDPRQLTVAVTAACNLRCAGCRYGRDFMLGERLPLSLVLDLLEDARLAGIERVRYYGGEPLLHPDLPAMVARARELGLEPYLTTNAILLGQRIDELFDAGLRLATIGFYGVGADYDRYAQRDGQYERLCRSLETVRARHGTAVELQLNYVMLRPTTNLPALRGAWEFARRFDMFLHVDLAADTFPFFHGGEEGELAFRPGDRGRIEEVVEELLRLSAACPGRVLHSAPFLRSIPDWLILGARMRVPCDAYQLVWVGADGSVQLCDVAFPLGNLHERRLREILFGDEHRRACRDGFALACPNCTCKVDSRIQKDAPSMRRYAA